MLCSVLLVRAGMWRTRCQSSKNISRLSHISLWKARTVLSTTLFLFSFYCSGTNFMTLGASGNNAMNIYCLSTELLDVLSSHQGRKCCRSYLLFPTNDVTFQFSPVSFSASVSWCETGCHVSDMTTNVLTLGDVKEADVRAKKCGV